MYLLPLLLSAAGLATVAPERVARVVDYEIAVAPDGAVAFASNRSGDFEIHSMNADGSELRKLTEGGAKDTPDWSPDGDKIVFISSVSGNADIYIADRDGGGVQRLTTNPLNDIHPFWSPDGKQIVFTRYIPDENDDDSGRLDVLIMNADGSDERRLVKGGSYGSLSPDGTQLLYWRYYGENADIVIASADGGGAERLTTNAAFDGWPSWSHDGKSIVFARRTESEANIFMLDLESGVEREVTNGAGRKTSPKWSADDAHIYFDGTIDGAQGIWRVEVAAE